MVRFLVKSAVVLLVILQKRHSSYSFYHQCYIIFDFERIIKYNILKMTAWKFIINN
jgi:hypothetical protein